MTDVSRPVGRTAVPLPSTAGPVGPGSRTAAEPESPELHRVGWRFVSLYTLAYMSTCLVFLAPALVTLALKVNSLVGIEQAPNSLALVTGTGALVSLLANPFF